MKKVVLLLLLCLPFVCNAQIITTFAGNGISGYSGDGGAATAAQFSSPRGVAIDNSGNIYISEFNNNCIRKVNTSGVITTFAGTGVAGFSGDHGPATIAKLRNPTNVAVGSDGRVYISDFYNHRIRVVDTSGIITTLAGNGAASFGGDGGPATAASFNGPNCLAIDISGNLYISDYANQRIRKINSSGIISTFAGNGTPGFSGDGGMASVAQICYCSVVATDAVGNVYTSEMGNARIRKINTLGIINTIAGNGTSGFTGDGGAATNANLNTPIGVVIDGSGNVYISDLYNYRIRKINTSGIINTIVGNGISGYSGDGGTPTSAAITQPYCLALDCNSNLYIADQSNNRIRKVINPNHSPKFSGGHLQSFSISCGDTSAHNIDSLLSVIDSDCSQTETWSVLISPVHGTLVVSYSTLSTGGLLLPVGLSYIATSGYVGTDSFLVRVSDGINSDTTKVIVTVNSNVTLDAIVGVDSMCIEGVVIFTDSTMGGTWSISNTNANISSSGEVTALSSGIDTVFYTISTACGTDTVHKILNILTVPIVSPIIGPNYVCIGSTITLTDSTIGGIWNHYNSNTYVSTTGVVSGLFFGTDTITYSLSNFCGFAMVSKAILVHTVLECDSIVKTDQNVLGNRLLEVYPNPANSFVNIELENVGTLGKVQLVNELGQVIFDEYIDNNIMLINTKNYVRGLYLIRVITNYKYFYTKLIIN